MMETPKAQAMDAMYWKGDAEAFRVLQADFEANLRKLQRGWSEVNVVLDVQAQMWEGFPKGVQERREMLRGVVNGVREWRNLVAYWYQIPA